MVVVDSCGVCASSSYGRSSSVVRARLRRAAATAAVLCLGAVLNVHHLTTTPRNNNYGDFARVRGRSNRTAAALAAYHTAFSAANIATSECKRAGRFDRCPDASSWNILRGGKPTRRELSEDSSSDDFENSWVYQHTVNRPFLCEVNPEWIRDTFNLNGLSTQIPHYEICLRRILDYEVGFDKLPPKKQAELEACCETLYGLVHARYITSPEGLDRMRQKYERGDFGACPRALCKGFRLLPVGITDELRLRPVKTFCPNCKELYHVRVRHAATIDGAFYTRTFPHMFLLKYPHLQPKCQPVKYQPTIFGFNVKYPDLPTADDYALQEKAKLEKEQAEARAKEEQAERGKDEEEKEENGSVDPNATSKKEQASQETKPKAGEPQPTSLLPGVPMDNQTVQPQDAEMKGRDQDPPAQNSSPVQTRT